MLLGGPSIVYKWVPSTSAAAADGQHQQSHRSPFIRGLLLGLKQTSEQPPRKAERTGCSAG